MLLVKRISLLALIAVTLWGCAPPQNKTQQGALYGSGIGAAVGAGLGQVIGGDTKATLIGAGMAVTFRSDVLFDVDSAVIKPGGYSEIDRVANVLLQYPQTDIQIAGHTDSTGSETYNQGLSERRAMSVKNALIDRGVSPARMRAVGFGESQPVADNANPSGRQMNRRVVVTIVPQEGATY
ncbi:MAG: OmpA family protein [Desulfuromonadales bacterium]